MTMQRVQFGDTTIEYTLSFAARKTLAISVHPDLRVTVTAPEHTDLDAIALRVQKRAAWILRQQREFELYLPHITPRQYVSGETHRYLGRQYRLKIVEEADAEWVRLERGYIHIRTTDKTDTAHIRELLESWYLRQARRVFKERLRALLPGFERHHLPPHTLKIRELTAHWGTCTANGTITLNVKLVQVNKSYIDYVIVHELCHLIEHNHSKQFYALLDRVLPAWRTRRQELNMQEVS